MDVSRRQWFFLEQGRGGRAVSRSGRSSTQSGAAAYAGPRSKCARWIARKVDVIVHGVQAVGISVRCCRDLCSMISVSFVAGGRRQVSSGTPLQSAEAFGDALMAAPRPIVDGWRLLSRVAARAA